MDDMFYIELPEPINLNYSGKNTAMIIISLNTPVYSTAKNRSNGVFMG